MKKFIILTSEGSTTAPNQFVEVNNLQVLGFVENVQDENQAIIEFVKENEWIIEAEFNVAEFIVYQVILNE